jgi:hypothetical protein
MRNLLLNTAHEEDPGWSFQGVLLGGLMPEKCRKCKEKLCHLCWFWWNDAGCKILEDFQKAGE